METCLTLHCKNHSTVIIQRVIVLLEPYRLGNLGKQSCMHGDGPKILFTSFGVYYFIV